MRKAKAAVPIMLILGFFWIYAHSQAPIPGMPDGEPMRDTPTEWYNFTAQRAARQANELTAALDEWVTAHEAYSRARVQATHVIDLKNPKARHVRVSQAKSALIEALERVTREAGRLQKKARSTLKRARNLDE